MTPRTHITTHAHQRKHHTVRALTLVALFGALACGPDELRVIDESDGRAADLPLGELEMALQIQDGTELTSLDWSIEGPAFARAGSVAVYRRAQTTLRMSGVPAGDGYTIKLSGGVAGRLTCRGSANFSVKAVATTAVSVQVRCSLTESNGVISVAAPINVCPIVRDLTVTPVELEPGDVAELRAAVVDVDRAPSALEVKWESSTAGLVSNGLEAHFTCTQAGRTTVRLRASDGDAACDAQSSVTIVCAAPRLPAARWPGPDAVDVLDAQNTFPERNISGATYQPSTSEHPGALWVVQNSPSRIFQIELSTDTAAAKLPSSGPWRRGRLLRYPDGAGEPDAEGLTFGADFDSIYVATERNNNPSGPSRLSVLRYDLKRAAEGDGTATSSDLRATDEWYLNGFIPPARSANEGLEAIAWIPDDYLEKRGLLDQATGAMYRPENYPDHGGGLFVVGVETTGMLYAFALDHAGDEATLVSSFSSGHPQVMDLAFDRDLEGLWAQCDDGCQGELALLTLPRSTPGTAGRFRLTTLLSRPSGMPNLANEGFAVAPFSECRDGMRRVFWTDDSGSAGCSLRSGLIECELPR